MLDFFRQLLESDFMPHGYCFGWRPDVLWLHVSSDAAIALSYYVIPIALIYLVRVRRDLAFHWMFGLFGLFILTCGTTHLLAIWTLWHPIYRMEGLLKAVAAVASASTAILLLRSMPEVIALPSPAQLRTANEALLREVAERRQAQDQVSRLNSELEQRVRERTAELEKSNQLLREANQHLAEAELRYRRLFQQNPLPMWVQDPLTGRFLAVNPGALELYGYSEAEFLSMTTSGLVSDEEASRSGETVELVAAQRHIRKDGSHLYVEIRSHEVVFGSQAARLVLSTDVTHRKMLEDQLRHSQKMEAVGRLAGGIAHDFNNLLTVILGYASVMFGRLKPGDPLRAMAEQIQRAGEHAASLTGQLLSFSRKQVTQPQVLSLNTVTQGMKDILQRLIGEDVDLSVVADPATPAVVADAGQLGQVIMNLAVNARDAMPAGGKLTIETGLAQRDREEPGRHAMRPAGRFAVLAVSDTGVGMDLETQSHIFEPFFTTKEAGKGTGLGLSTAYGIVQQHGGWIDVYSAPGQGTTFRVYFPEAAGSVGDSGTTAAGPAVRRGATILLAEDQAAVRMLAEDVLSEAGHRVLPAVDGRSALGFAERFDEPIDLLITDVVMPEMNGPDLAARLMRSRPGLSVLYTSGYTDHALLHQGTIAEGTAFLQKPFLPETLLAKVDELLGRRRR